MPTLQFCQFEYPQTIVGTMVFMTTTKWISRADSAACVNKPIVKLYKTNQSGHRGIAG